MGNETRAQRHQVGGVDRLGHVSISVITVDTSSGKHNQYHVILKTTVLDRSLLYVQHILYGV